ncbi:MAG: tyrosine-type recombinase/integrase [Chitinophagaceae bacterium]
MENISLLPVIHRRSEQLLIRFDNLRVLNDIVRKLPGIRWSQTYKSWYLPLSEKNYQLIWKSLRPFGLINTDSLREYLLKRAAVKASEVPAYIPGSSDESIDSNPTPVVTPSSPQPSAAYRLSFENLKSLEQCVRQLTLKAYSRSTIRTYRAELLVFFQVLGKHSATGLTVEDVKRWLLKCINEGLTENTMHSRINALKFFYEQVLGRDKFFVDIPRPKKAQQLPNVLGEREITRLFNALTNKKHKAILFTAYSAGLRVSEVVNLKLKDVDSDRMQLFIERAKGKKDRYVGLSPVLLDVLRNYIKMCRLRPLIYLFEGTPPGSIFSSRSAQKIFQMARQKAGIRKEVSFHSLRHSFATHVLEKGIDIRYIKDILGHFNIKTTERYLHVRKDQLINIVSPLDDIWKKGGLEW